MRVVFDSNILISALTLPGGRGEQAITRIIEGADSLFFSKQILDEVLLVLARKFSRDREQLARTAVFLSTLGDLVEPEESVALLADEPDNRILECALAGRAECIVTGDRAMLALGEFRGIRIVTLSRYLE
ncbi:MAG TPA: putative toxin-antitoxin system toxin component, PIN family [Burkholderiales bacterium]|nr:putative toxin-antitoxin system toxin component, PIN family [Burkholderiales bacterium]